MDWREDRIRSAARGENPTVLAEMRSGYAVIGDVQFLPGYCVLLAKDPEARALSELSRLDRVQFLADADLLAMAVESACLDVDPGFLRTNLEVLGNTDAFVHAHVWPRYSWEPPELVRKPVWLRDRGSWEDPVKALGPHHDALRLRIAERLSALMAMDQVRVTNQLPLGPHLRRRSGGISRLGR